MKVDVKKIKPMAAGIIPVAVVAAFVSASVATYEAPKYDKISAADYITETEKVNSVGKKTSKSVNSVNDEEAPSVKTIDEKSTTYKDGTYEGTGTGFGGELKVQVTIKDGKITEIKLLSHNDDTPYITNAQKLLQNIIATQSTNVDTISGATYSSVGLINAVRDALSKAGGTEEKIKTVSSKKSSSSGTVNLSSVDEPSTYKDGVYQGSATGYGGITTVEVTVSGGKITNIEILSHHDDSPYINNASALINTIISAQSTNVDAVSGATYSSAGIINAVRDALSKAGGTGEAAENITVSQSKSKSDSSSANITTVDEPSTYKDGKYQGSATGYGGTTTVEVTITGGQITKIDILSHHDDSPYIDNAKALINSIISKQSTNVDAVSGATYSSAGIINAVREALSKAGGSSESSLPKVTVASTAATTKKTRVPSTQAPVEIPSDGYKYADGTYEGTGEGYKGDVRVSVTVSDHKIVSVKILETVDDEEYFSKAKVLCDNIVKTQSSDIDTVSGATFSSCGILDAVSEALSKSTNKALEELGATTVVTTTTTTTTTAKPATTPSESEDINLLNGSFTGTAVCYPDDSEDFDAYELSVKVTFKNGVITAISNAVGNGDTYDSSNDWYISRAVSGTSKKKGVVSQIIENQNTDGIDAVSGATCSSNAIVEAVANAWEQANASLGN